MRLLRLSHQGGLSLTEDLLDDIPPYAILSHTWGADSDEVTFTDVQDGVARQKDGYAKIEFCGEQARTDGIEYFWVDTCCINKANLSEQSEAITSMFRWYRDAVKCYVYLSDVSAHKRDRDGETRHIWESSFRTSRWFTRGWTLQELLAPKAVEFFSREMEFLGTKTMLVQHIHEITGIPKSALEGTPLSLFPVRDRMQWAAQRQTKKKEDRAYCLLGIFDVFLPLIYGEGDNAFVRLQEEINKRSGASEKSAHVHWVVPRSANPLFTGREDILQELDRLVRDAVGRPWDGTQCRIVISGMGGQGKSEICLQLARRLRHLFWAVLWIDISTTANAERSFLDVAQTLSIPSQTWEDACLGIANLKHSWLLVLDNADAPDVDYLDYFPDGPLGVVILASRNDECQHYATVKPIALEGLKHGEARELLFKAARLPQEQHSVHEDDAQAIVSLLQSHPLALIQAGAYVFRGHCKLSEYPRVYEERRRQLLAFRPAQARSRYRDVYTTFEVSVDTLKAINTEATRDALQLLPLLAMCGPSRLPLVLFEAAWKGAQFISSDIGDDVDDDEVLLLTPWHASHIPPFLKITDAVWNPFRLVEAVAVLKAFSLISTDSRDGELRVSMHALVHAWARDRQNDGDQHQSWLQMGCVVALALCRGSLSPEHRRWLQLHVEAMTEWDMAKIFAKEPPMLITRVLVCCGWYLYTMRSDAKLFTLMQQLFEYLGLDRSEVKRTSIGLYDLMAGNLVDYGKIQEGVAVLQEVIKIRQQSLPKDHPDRLASQYTLARAYEANGQVEEAVALLEEVLRIEEKVLAKDHPDRLASQHELARVYKANGQVKEAVALLEEVVKIREQSLVKDHPDRLASQHALAGAYNANGQVKEAVALLEKVVRIREQSLIKDHPDRLASQHTLAGIYEVNGQVKEAVALLEEVVRIQEESLPKDHPDRLASQHELARVYKANGQVEEAVALLEEVVRIEEKSLAKDHPDRLASQHALAGAYKANGQVQEAVVLLEEVVRIEKSLAKDHPDRLASQHGLAVVYLANGQVKEAVALLEEVVRVREQSFAQDHPGRLASQHTLAGAYKANGQVKEAVTLLEEVVRIQEQSLAKDHPDRLSSQHTLAGAYKANGHVKEAVALLEDVVRIRNRSLTKDHPDRLASQHALAGAYKADGQVKQAAALLEEVVRIREQSLAKDHPDRLSSLHELAGVYSANGQVKEAVALLEEVVTIEEKSLAKDHPDRLASQHALAGVYNANGQVKEAVALLEEVVRIRERSLAKVHPDRLASQQTLAGVYKANGQVKKAVALLEEVVRIREQSLAKDHPDRLTSQRELAGAYKANGSVEEAVVLLEEVVRIREQSLAKDHPDRLTSQHELAGTYKANGQAEKAVALLEEVVEIREQSLAKDHPDRLTSQHELAGAYKANGQVEKAVALLEEVVRIREQSLAKDHPDRLASQHELAGAYKANGSVEEAVALLEEVVRIRDQSLAKIIQID